MTRLFQDDGRHVPVTVLSLEGTQVVARKEVERDGYVALQLGAGVAKAKNVAKPQRGHFAKAELNPRRVWSNSASPRMRSSTSAPKSPLTISSLASWSTLPVTPRVRALPVL
ncbi:hypothetical protein [Sphingobium yanoikuyae]|uniref:hypothetical protein n=1 Tax=Sphingobium yanoikuyae TaxID=13690 RepID=UPI00345E5C58